ncbi:hypothetical protein MPLSOD_330049 [Mesorhizobium sp. SOD10]|nr:hypothetical protein MPLSOD_330049 [Mesorhizobium sp. SOD10]
MGALERGDSERALAIYTDSIQPSVTAGIPINVISDTASFLWRLQAYGHTTPAGGRRNLLRGIFPEARLHLRGCPHGPYSGSGPRLGRGRAAR